MPTLFILTFIFALLAVGSTTAGKEEPAFYRAVYAPGSHEHLSRQAKETCYEAIDLPAWGAAGNADIPCALDRKEVVMMRPFGLELALASALALAACTSISYKLALSLGPSPVKIPAKIQVETFIDRSPSEDKSKRALGVSATEPDTLAGDLATEVTNAVIADFLVNGVFAEAGKSIKNPDAVMTGEIKRFYGRAGINAAGVITLPINPIWFLGVPMQSSEGEVDLAVSIRRPDGTVLGTYSGRSQFSDWYTMYNNSIHGVGTALNKSFNQAIRQIRDQIIADKDKF